MDTLQRFTTEFDGKKLTTMTYKGEPVWIAKEVGSALGYEEEGRGLVKRARGDWKDEFKDGRDFRIVKGDDLKQLRTMLDVGPESGPSRAPSLMLLTESGMYLCCLKTHKPQGVQLRRLLAETILPQLQKTGQACLPGVNPNPALSSISNEQFATIMTQLSSNLAGLREDVRSIRDSGFTTNRFLPPPVNQDATPGSRNLPPALPTTATSASKEAQETIIRFLQEICTFGVTKWSPKLETYRAYEQWCHVNNYMPVTRPSFEDVLTSRGMVSGRHAKGAVWRGLVLQVLPENMEQLRLPAVAATDTWMSMRQFSIAWWKTFGEETVTPSELLPLLKKEKIDLDIHGNTLRAKAGSLGAHLRRFHGVILGDLRIEVIWNKRRGTYLYRVIGMRQAPVNPPDPSSPYGSFPQGVAPALHALPAPSTAA